MARRPTQPRLSTPPSQGFVAGGNTPGLGGEAGYEIGRLSAEIENLKHRIGELEGEAKGVGRFHTGVKTVGGLATVVLVVLWFFVGDDVRTLLSMADAEQVHKSDKEEQDRQKLLQQTGNPSLPVP